MASGVDDEASEMYRAVDELLDNVAVCVPTLSSPPDPSALYRLYAAAALSRAHATLRAARTLVDAGHVDGVGLLARSVWESWLIGTYILVYRDEALVLLTAEQLRQQRNLAERNDVGVDVLALIASRQAALKGFERARRRALGLEVSDDDAIDFARLKLEDIARDLGPALVRTGREERADVSGAYDILYRSHSTFDAHGIDALERYLDADDEVIAVQTEPGSWLLEHHAIALAAIHVAMLANYVFEEFAIATDELEVLGDRLLSLLSRIAASEVDNAVAANLPGPWDRFVSTPVMPDDSAPFRLDCGGRQVAGGGDVRGDVESSGWRVDEGERG